MLVTPGVDNMALALSNLSFFPLPVRFLLLGTLGAPQVGRYREVLSCSRRSMWIGCCRPIVTKNARLWPPYVALLLLLWSHDANPFNCAPRWICCRDGEVLSRVLLWGTAQAWLRVVSSFLQQSLRIWLTFSWSLLAQNCYLPNSGWVLAGK